MISSPSVCPWVQGWEEVGDKMAPSACVTPARPLQPEGIHFLSVLYIEKFM